MSTASGDVVTGGELRARMRTTYVDSCARRQAAAGRAGDTGLLPEVTGCQADGEFACA